MGTTFRRSFTLLATVVLCSSLVQGTAHAAPTITTQPTSQTGVVGGTVTLSVTATGTNPVTYQWRKGGTDIGGATLSSYTINPVGASDAASYDCVVSGASPCGSVTSSAAALTVSPFRVGTDVPFFWICTVNCPSATATSYVPV